jgi:hypothetical protein
MAVSTRAVVGVALALLVVGGAAANEEATSPIACSIWLASHPASATQSQHRRTCVVAVASSYIDAEENSQPSSHQLLTDDVSRHRIGTPPEFQPGNRNRLMADNRHDVIAAIRNRRWTVEGDEAWILYDGYLKKDPDKIGFYVAERITLQKGLIREILVADITLPK